MNLSDKRERYTLQAIRETFLSLLAEKPVSKITVVEICRQCDINRATFYRYYHDQYDLLEQIEGGMIKNLEKRLSAEELGDMRALLYKSLTELQADKDTYLIIVSANGDPSFLNKIARICYEKTISLFRFKLRRCSLREQEMLYRYITEGYSGVVRYWLQRDQEIAIDQAVDFLRVMILSNVWFFQRKSSDDMWEILEERKPVEKNR